MFYGFIFHFRTVLALLHHNSCLQQSLLLFISELRLCWECVRVWGVGQGENWGLLGSKGLMLWSVLDVNSCDSFDFVMDETDLKMWMTWDFPAWFFKYLRQWNLFWRTLSRNGWAATFSILEMYKPILLHQNEPIKSFLFWAASFFVWGWGKVLISESKFANIISVKAGL